MTSQHRAADEIISVPRQTRISNYDVTKNSAASFVEGLHVIRLKCFALALNGANNSIVQQIRFQKSCDSRNLDTRGPGQISYRHWKRSIKSLKNPYRLLRRSMCVCQDQKEPSRFLFSTWATTTTFNTDHIIVHALRREHHRTCVATGTCKILHE